MKPWYTKTEISKARSVAKKIVSKCGINNSSMTCHVKIPKNVDLSILFPNVKSAEWRLKNASLVDKEVEIHIASADYTFTPKPIAKHGKICCSLYAHRDRITRLRQCGLFPMLEREICYDNESDIVEELAKFLVKIIHFSKKDLKIEFDDLNKLPKHLQYLSDDSSEDCF